MITKEPLGMSGSGGSGSAGVMGGGDSDGVDDEGGQFSSLSFFLWENEGVHQTGNYLLHKVRYSPSSL